MWLKVLGWLLKFALEQLGENVSAEGKAMQEAYDRQRADVERKREAAEIELGRIDSERMQLDAKRIVNQQEIEYLAAVLTAQENQIDEIRKKRDKNIEDINRRSDDDVLRGDL